MNTMVQDDTTKALLDSKERDAMTAASTTATEASYLDQPCRSTRPEYAHIPEARDLKWNDDFFDDDDDVVAVFDLDYDAMESFYTQLGFVSLGLSVLYPPIFVIASALLAPCYLRSNVQWSVRATHVAVTRDGIRFVRARRPSCWGLSCTDVGKHSKTVPFDKITDCDVSEPAGNACLCCVPRVLHTVNIDTASSNQERHELKIQGMIEPYKFKKLVWAMKRQTRGDTNSNSMPSALEMIERAGGASNNSNEEVTSLLREIRDELRQNNAAIVAMNSQKQDGINSMSAIEELRKKLPLDELMD